MITCLSNRNSYVNSVAMICWFIITNILVYIPAVQNLLEIMLINIYR